MRNAILSAVLLATACSDAQVVVDNVGRISPNGSDPEVARSKCLNLGYAQGNGLEACERAIRADFCGDGSSLTVDGTIIDISDSFGVVTDTNDWTVEAEWTELGASCVSSIESTRAWREAHVSPPCEIIVIPTCGSAGGIVTKLPGV